MAQKHQVGSLTTTPTAKSLSSQKLSQAQLQISTTKSPTKKWHSPTLSRSPLPLFILPSQNSPIKFKSHLHSSTSDALLYLFLSAPNPNSPQPEGGPDSYSGPPKMGPRRRTNPSKPRRSPPLMAAALVAEEEGSCRSWVWR